MLNEGLGLMAAGMGMVFAFLILLVVVMKLSASLFSHFPTSPTPLIERRATGAGGSSYSGPDLEEIAAAIAAARSRMPD